MVGRLGWGKSFRTRAVAGWIAAPALLLAGCEQKNAYVPPPPPKVTVAPPVERPVTRYLETTGNAAAVNSADLVARVNGFVETIDYQDGDFVKKDKLLFTIEPKPYQLKLNDARAVVASAQATRTQTQTEYQRQADLMTSGTNTQARLDTAVANRDTAIANLDQAQYNEKLAEINFGYTHVTAPFDGIVTARKVSVGAYVGGGASPTVLSSIVQISPIYVNFNVSERDVLDVRAEIRKRGLTPEDLRKVPVEIGLQIEQGFPHKGTLDYAAPTVDASTGTLLARAILENPDRALLPGMFVRVRVPMGGPQNALLVPNVAIGTDQGGRYVLVVGKDNVVEQRPVTTGQVEGDLRVITKGLKAGERVVINGMLRAVPGQKVDPQTGSATPAANGKS